MPDLILIDAISEITQELLTHGSIIIGGEEIHVMDLYQYGDQDDQANLIFMTIRDPESAKEFATKIINDCATSYFENNQLVITYLADKHSEY
jgi:hypothetical protein